MSVPLDDLYPTNDESYIPPETCDELFLPGGGAWDQADVWKWQFAGDVSFRLGYQAQLFDILLKSGRPFMMRLFGSEEIAEEFKRRAECFGRTVEFPLTAIPDSVVVIVSKHKIT